MGRGFGCDAMDVGRNHARVAEKLALVGNIGANGSFLEAIRSRRGREGGFPSYQRPGWPRQEPKLARARALLQPSKGSVRVDDHRS